LSRVAAGLRIQPVVLARGLLRLHENLLHGLLLHMVHVMHNLGRLQRGRVVDVLGGGGSGGDVDWVLGKLLYGDGGSTRGMHG